MEAEIGGHYPISVLVSCKDHGRPISVTHIETLQGEIRSTAATCGVIYSRYGYTKSAQLKALANNIVCCRLFQSQPADLPEIIPFPTYACKPRFCFQIISIADSFTCETWNALFDLKTLPDSDLNMLEVICDDFRKREKEEVKKTPKRKFPADWFQDYSIFRREQDELLCSFRVHGIWGKHRGRTQAYLLNGSYCLTSSQFLGSQAGPILDTKGKDPGEDWEEIIAIPDTLPNQCILAILTGGDVAGAARENLGPQPLRVKLNDSAREKSVS